MRVGASRWRRSLEQQPRTLDGNRTGQTEPDRDENPERGQGPEEDDFPGPLSSEQPDNSSQIEVLLLGRGRTWVEVWMLGDSKLGLAKQCQARLS